MASKKTGTAVVPWQEEMRKSVSKQKAAEKPTGEGLRGISIQGGILSIDNEEVEGNELDVVVLVAMHENMWYDKDFVPGTPTVPACYALSDPAAEDPEAALEAMAAHEKADRPQGGEDVDEGGGAGSSCEGCWANKFGSADKGRGKACRNTRRLAVITADSMESAESITEAEVRRLSVPVMSAKNWGQYVRTKLSDELELPYYAVVTNIKVVPDRKAQFMIKFEFKEQIEFTQETWDALKKKMEFVTPLMTQPYPSQSELDAMREAEQAEKKGAAKGRGAPPAKKVIPVKSVPVKPGKAPPPMKGKARKF